MHTWLICDMSHAHVTHLCTTWVMSHTSSHRYECHLYECWYRYECWYLWHDVYDMSHSHVYHGSSLSSYDTTQIWMRLELWHDTDMNETRYDTTQIWMRLALCSRLSSSSLIHICVVCRVTSCNSKGHGLIFDITGSCHVYECLISHIRINHSAHMHETRRTYMNESCDTYEWVMSLGAARDSRGYGLTFHTYLHTYNYIYTRRNESSHTYEWVVSPGAARDSRGHGHIFEWQHWVHLGIYFRARPVMRHELYIRLRNELA